MKRRTRHFAALFALLAFTFAQLATAAYACPKMMQPQAAAAMTDCHHGSNPSPNLCENHCDHGKISVDPLKPLNPPAIVAVIVRPLAVVIPLDVPRAPRCARIATGPPPTRFTVLRI